MSTKSPDLKPRPPEFKQLVTDNKVKAPTKGGKSVKGR